MNNLHRELAPVSDAAWAQIEEETARTLKRYLAGRRVVDVPAQGGIALPGVGTGHLKPIAAPAEGILAGQREVKPLVELRVPFELSRREIDDVERGADDSDWQLAKDAAKKLAFAEDRAVFNGYTDADIRGIRECTSNPIETLPADVRDYPDAIAHALSQLRLMGVNGPYSVLLGAGEYTAPRRDPRSRISRTRAREAHRGRQPDLGACDRRRVRCDDARRRLELSIGQDISIGYLSHNDSAVQLYLQETFVFRVLTTEAAVALLPPQKSS